MVTKWNDAIAASPEESHVVDLAQVFEKLFCSNIVHICFGEDVSEEMQFEIDFRNKDKPGPDFIRKTVTLGEAIVEYDNQCLASLPFKQFNPLYQIARALTGK